MRTLGDSLTVVYITQVPQDVQQRAMSPTISYQPFMMNISSIPSFYSSSTRSSIVDCKPHLDSRSVTPRTGDSSFRNNASLASAIEERISNPSSVSDGSGIENLIPGSDGGGIENPIPVSDGGIGIENPSSVSDHGCKNWQATFEDLNVLRVVESFSDDMGDHHELSVGEHSRGIQGRDEETKEEQMGMTLEYDGYKGRDDVIVVEMETGLTVLSAEKTPLIFKGSYGGEEYRKEGTEHSENSLVVKSSTSSMSSTSAATSTDFCCCSIDNTTSSSSTPSSFSVEFQIQILQILVGC